MKKLLFAAAILAGTAASANDYAIGDIAISHPFAFATVGNSPVGGGYMKITNGGTTDDIPTDVTVAPEVAGMAQMHEMTMEEGVMRMGEVPGRIAVPAGKTVTLESGGLHVMFMRLPAGLKDGAEIPATLTFEQAGSVDVVFTVEARGSNGHAAHGN